MHSILQSLLVYSQWIVKASVYYDGCHEEWTSRQMSPLSSEPGLEVAKWLSLSVKRETALSRLLFYRAGGERIYGL